MGIEDDGFGTIYKNADGSVAQGGGATLIFWPNGAPSGNIYDDWDALYEARQSILGHVTIEFDDSEDLPVIPDGEYDLTDTVLRGRPAPWATQGRVEIRTSNNTVLLGLDEVVNLEMYLYNTDPLIVVAGESFFLKVTNSAIYDENGGGLISIVSGEVWIYLTENSALYDDDGYVITLDGSSFLGIQAWDNSVLGSYTVNGTGCFVLLADASCTISLNQGQAVADLYIDKADRMSFNYDVGKWANSVPNVDAALNRMAALLYTLNSNTPIPTV